MMEQIAWLIPLLPLLGFLINSLANRSLSEGVSGAVACLTVFGAFVFSCILFAGQLEHGQTVIAPLFDWISVGDFKASFSLQIDPLSSLFLLIITGVGFLIHLYSVAYLKHDDGIRRYFAYLNLFVFFMLLLVMGDNFLLMFVGWEGVGLCSYLLIGYWFKKVEYAAAAKKAFVMNRIGDLGFLLGLILIYTTFGSISFQEVFSKASVFTANTPVIVSITLLLFIGAVGKSAQIPLYTWLPDAMAGPTPVSALIHAATMVTAGIYMISRSNVLFALAPTTLAIIAGIGLATALLAATIGLLQNDIKKILAYSTVSQLGYMFLALGLGAFGAGVFHVLTHAFFKALLFLGAGSVIHAMSGEQDIRKMGGLRKALPVTYLTFLIGTLAISGIPPFAGFFSKDEILAYAFQAHPFIWILGVAGSLMTCFYMFRLFFLTFSGKFRGTEDQKQHLHESPWQMTTPLIVLAILSVVGGFIGLPHVMGHHWLQHFLEPVMGLSETKLHLDAELEWGLMAASVALVAIFIFLAYRHFVVKEKIPADSAPRGFAALVANTFYVDQIYDTLIRKPMDAIAKFSNRVLENKIFDALVNGIGHNTTQLSNRVRLIQNGNLGFYVFAMVISIIVILFISLI